MSQITNSLREFIEANQYQHTEIDDGCYRMPFTGTNGRYDMLATASDERGQVTVLTYCPVYVPESKRSLVADYLNRVNYGLYLGCLEMDINTGEVRARSSAPVSREDVPQTVFRSLFDSSFYLMDNWLPGTLRIAFGLDDARTAFDTTLAGFSGEAIEPSGQDEAQLQETASDPGPSLTALEEEVSRLLAERDSEPDSPAQPS